MACRLCETTPRSWNGDDRRCAFGAGVFSADNWNCETMNRLRSIVDEDHHRAYNDDQYCGVIPMLDESGRFIVLGWYKSRGATEAATVLNEHVFAPLTIALAEECISAHEAWKARR